MNEMTQLETDMLIALKDHEGYSSGELSILLDVKQSEIKQWMRLFEKAGYGQFTIQDGMYHFWFSPYGNETYNLIAGV